MRENNKAILTGIFILITFVLLSGCGKKEEQLGSVKEMEYIEINGTTFYPEDFLKEKKLVLAVNTTLWDPVSIEQIRALNRLQNKCDSQDLGILVIIHETDSLRHDVWELKKQEECDFPFIMADEKAAKVFRKEDITPTILVIENGKDIRQQIKGYISDENLEIIVKKYLKSPKS